MKSAIGIILRSSFAAGEIVHVVKHELFEVYLTEACFESVSGGASGTILIEQLGRTWIVLLLDFNPKVRWDELREAILGYATECAFMHPQVFEDFTQACHMLGLKDSDSIDDQGHALTTPDGYKRLNIRLRNEDGSNIVKRR